MPEELCGDWHELIAESVKSSCLCFPRTVKPAEAVGLPLVVEFSDGAFPAFAAAVYLQWQIACKHGNIECDMDLEVSLSTAKAKVTPQHGAQGCSHAL